MHYVCARLFRVLSPPNANNAASSSRMIRNERVLRQPLHAEFQRSTSTSTLIVVYHRHTVARIASEQINTQCWRFAFWGDECKLLTEVPHHT